MFPKRIKSRPNFLRNALASIPEGGHKNIELIDKVLAKVEEYTTGYKQMQPVISASQKDELDRIADEGIKVLGG